MAGFFQMFLISDKIGRVKPKEKAYSDSYLESRGYLAPEDRQQCWYCGAAPALPDDGVGIGVTRGPVNTPQFERMLVYVPACRRCKAIIMRQSWLAFSLIFGPLTLGMLGGLIVGFTGRPDQGLWRQIGGALIGVAIGVTVTFVLGLFLAWIVDLLVSWRARRLRRESMYPPLTRLREDGWITRVP